MSGAMIREDDVAAAPPGAGRGGFASALAQAGSPTPAPPRRGRPEGRLWVAVTGLALALTVLTAGLFAGILPAVRTNAPSATTPGGPSAALTYYAALVFATAYARTAWWLGPGNPFPGLVFAAGLDSPTDLSAPVNASQFLGVRCSPIVLSSPIPSVPAFRGSISSGVSPYWVFGFSTGGTAIWTIGVVNDTATPLASLVRGGSCYSGPGAWKGGIVVDSSLAADVVAHLPSAVAFLARATSSGSAVSAEFRLLPPGSLADGPAGAPIWSVTYSTCPLVGSPSSSGSELVVPLDALTGAVLSESQSEAPSC